MAREGKEEFSKEVRLVLTAFEEGLFASASKEGEISEKVTEMKLSETEWEDWQLYIQCMKRMVFGVISLTIGSAKPHLSLV
jgi:hypothetical protein